MSSFIFIFKKGVSITVLYSKCERSSISMMGSSPSICTVECVGLSDITIKLSVGEPGM